MNLLKSMDKKLDSLKKCEAKVDKVVEDVTALRAEISELEAFQTGAGAKIDSVVNMVNDFENRLSIVESKSKEAKAALSIADEAVLLRTACEQVADQFVINGIPENNGENVCALIGATISALGIQLDEAEVIDAYRVGKAPRAGPQGKGMTLGSRTIIVKLKLQSYVTR